MELRQLQKTRTEAKERKSLIKYTLGFQLLSDRILV
jgi:hypothetical protein